MNGLLADNNIRGLVEYLVQRMQAEPWAEFWQALGLVLFHFEDIGLLPEASDLEVWQRCQEDRLILITDNRNDDSADSLEAVLRRYNRADSLPVFTIAALTRFRKDRSYADRVIESLYEYLFRIDTVRGTGRLYLP